MPSDRRLNRRHFFSQGLRELLKPLASALDPVQRVADELGQMERTGALGSAVLRPPGAIRESLFVRQCDRSGQCVAVCPVQAIKLDPQGKVGGGAAYIDADTSACAVCSGLHCMTACPSGALLPVPMVEIDMGTAVWRQTSCLRHHGQDCTLCLDQCPLGSAAIELIDSRIVVHPLGCIGCGLCQQHCPTSPRSIMVIPKAMKES